MSVRNTAREGKAALFDSTSGFAFGPVFDSDIEAELFLDFAAMKHPGKDIRELFQAELVNLWVMWCDEDDKR